MLQEEEKPMATVESLLDRVKEITPISVDMLRRPKGRGGSPPCGRRYAQGGSLRCRVPKHREVSNWNRSQVQGGRRSGARR